MALSASVPAKVSANRYASPLRYPGGKGKVTNFLKLLLIENGLLGIEYVEPYAGGAAVALNLLFEDYASHVHINDINRGLHAFWRAVLDKPDELCARIEGVRLTVDEWHAQRAIYARAPAGSLDLGFATFFLNRTNRSGIIHKGGLIGGLDQTGEWKIDARFNREELCRRVQKVSRFRTRITITRLDAAKLLRSLSSHDPSKQKLIYLDPPYYVKGRGLYDDFYTPQNHIGIADLVRALPYPWIVSYDAVPAILDMYDSSRSLRYSLSYSASVKHQGSEVMFFSDNLSIPSASSAACVPSFEVDEARLHMVFGDSG